MNAKLEKVFRDVMRIWLEQSEIAESQEGGLDSMTCPDCGLTTSVSIPAKSQEEIDNGRALLQEVRNFVQFGKPRGPIHESESYLVRADMFDQLRAIVERETP